MKRGRGDYGNRTVTLQLPDETYKAVLERAGQYGMNINAYIALHLNSLRLALSDYEKQNE